MFSNRGEKKWPKKSSVSDIAVSCGDRQQISPWYAREISFPSCCGDEDKNDVNRRDESSSSSPQLEGEDISRRSRGGGRTTAYHGDICCDAAASMPHYALTPHGYV